MRLFFITLTLSGKHYKSRYELFSDFYNSLAVRIVSIIYSSTDIEIVFRNLTLSDKHDNLETNC